VKDNPYQPPAPVEAILAEQAGSGESAAAMRKAAVVFRALLALYAVLVVATIVASFAGEAYLPGELQAYVAAQEEMELTGMTAAMDIVASIALALLLPGWLGLFFFWRPSRWLFLTAEVLFLIAILLFGPTVTNSVEGALDRTSQLASGAILAMAFFSPVRRRFAKRTAAN
jgi:hypothetical protein